MKLFSFCSGLIYGAMKKSVTLTLLAAALVALASAAGNPLPPDSTLRRMAAQMLMVGFRGDTVDENSDAARYVRDLGVGAIILFDIDLTGDATLGSRNITSRDKLEQTTARLRGWSRTPLLIALDQEGGRVARLKPQYGFTPTVSAASLGRAANADTTRHYAALIAGDLARSGVNVNLAPVVDLHDPLCPPLGGIDRCFSANADSVAWHAGIFIDEHHRHGVLTTLKHFPGHGHAHGDSHWGLVDITSTWTDDDLQPFQTLIDNHRADIIMTAHVFLRDIDPDYPATLSRDIIDGLLRKRLHYDGVVLSDDMYMQGIIDNFDIDNAIVLAINAGVDMLCVGNNISTGFEADRPFRLVDLIVNAVHDGRIPFERIIEANARIARLKHTPLLEHR